MSARGKKRRRKPKVDVVFEVSENPKVDYLELYEYVNTSPLQGLFVMELPENRPPRLSPKELKTICLGLEQVLEEDLTYEQLTALFVASSMVYLMSCNYKNFECRTELLHKTFRYTNTLDPVHLHFAAKRLHRTIKSGPNLLFLCKNISFSSEMGSALSMCLVWGMFLDAMGADIDMYCFHTFSLINELLCEINFENMLKTKESSKKAHFILQLIAYLVTNVVSKSNKELKDAGYSEYFSYDMESVHTLRDWARNINQHISVSVKDSNRNFDLIMAIKETIAFDIVTPLDEKLKSFDGGREFGLVHTLY